MHGQYKRRKKAWLLKLSVYAHTATAYCTADLLMPRAQAREC